jgi:hypothetical protein
MRASFVRKVGLGVMGCVLGAPLVFPGATLPAGLRLGAAAFADPISQPDNPRRLPAGRMTNLTEPHAANDFALYWAVWPARRDWQDLDITNVRWRDTCVMIYNTWFGDLYPRPGPHMILLHPGGKEAYYTAFISRLNELVDEWAPDPNFRGLICLDLEFFQPNYTSHPNWASNLPLEDRTDYDFIDDWKETLRTLRASEMASMTPSQQDEYFREQWLATTREFYTRIFNAVKARRPNAKVGFYNMPVQSYFEWRMTDTASQRRWAHDQEAAWFFEMVDAVFPSIYPFYYSVPNGQTPERGTQDTYADFERYIRDNLTEALRVARGKPVYAFVTKQYHPSNSRYSYQLSNEFNTERPFEIAREMGCSGVVLWGWIQTQQQFNEHASSFSQSFSPFMRQFQSLPSLAANRAAPASPSPGSGGGGTTSSGPANPGTGPGRELSTPNAPVVPSNPGGTGNQPGGNVAGSPESPVAATPPVTPSIGIGWTGGTYDPVAGLGNELAPALPSSDSDLALTPTVAGLTPANLLMNLAPRGPVGVQTVRSSQAGQRAQVSGGPATSAAMLVARGGQIHIARPAGGTVVTHVDVAGASRVTMPSQQASASSLREALARASAMRAGRMADAIVKPMAAGQTLRQVVQPGLPVRDEKMPAAPAFAEVPTE